MRTFLSVALLPLLSTGLAACGGDLDCGEGTHEEDGSCVADEDTDRYEGEEPGDCSDDADNDRDGLFDCDDDGCAGSSDCTGGDTDSDTGSTDGPLIGLVFVQAGGVGHASYHFDEVDDIYIRYDNVDMQMDNGLQIPNKKAFTDTSFYLEQRTFFGTIDWSDPEGTTLFGTEVWLYEMIFDKSYSQIVDGTVEAYSSSGDLIIVQSFSSDLSYERL